MIHFPPFFSLKTLKFQHHTLCVGSNDRYEPQFWHMISIHKWNNGECSCQRWQDVNNSWQKKTIRQMCHLLVFKCVCLNSGRGTHPHYLQPKETCFLVCFGAPCFFFPSPPLLWKSWDGFLTNTTKLHVNWKSGVCECVYRHVRHMEAERMWFFFFLKVAVCVFAMLANTETRNILIYYSTRCFSFAYYEEELGWIKNTERDGNGRKMPTKVLHICQMRRSALRLPPPPFLFLLSPPVTDSILC